MISRVAHKDDDVIRNEEFEQGESQTCGLTPQCLFCHCLHCVKLPSFPSSALLGRLAHAAGDIDTASSHFVEALSFCRKAAYRPELARTCVDYATVLAESAPASRDHKAIISLLDEALEISSSIGMPFLESQVTSVKELVQQGLNSSIV